MLESIEKKAVTLERKTESMKIWGADCDDTIFENQ